MARRITSISIAIFAALFAGAQSATPEHSDATAASDTIRGFDKDGNGRVNLMEIEDFAKKNGISTEEIRNDFHDLDRNADGELDTQEIGGLLGSGGPSLATVVAPSATASATAPFTATVPSAAAEAELAKVSRVAESTAQSEVEADQEAVPSLEALEMDAQRQAGGVLAEGLARRAQDMMQQGEKDEQQAASFEAKAQSLRGRAGEATKTIGADARRAAQEAVAANAEKGLV